MQLLARQKTKKQLYLPRSVQGSELWAAGGGVMFITPFLPPL
jgi:hypothetical protein